MAKKIEWSVTAQNDRKAIFAYWNNRNKSTVYSRKLHQLFKEAAKAIADFPAIGRPSGYKDTRIKIVRDYLMVYKVLDTRIVIITIWDGRQHPLKLEKLLR
jgi:addiction module RelE/StbE family toxin